jgi:hypothetical protein
MRHRPLKPILSHILENTVTYYVLGVVWAWVASLLHGRFVQFLSYTLLVAMTAFAAEFLVVFFFGARFRRLRWHMMQEVVRKNPETLAFYVIHPISFLLCGIASGYGIFGHF